MPTPPYFRHPHAPQYPSPQQLTATRMPQAAHETAHDATLTDEYLGRIDAYWRAANYLSVGQIYLLDNPLLQFPLQIGHIKPRLLGHWGTTPG